MSTAVTPYDRLIWTDAQVEHWLVNDEHKRELVIWFGHDNWVELSELAKRAHRARSMPRDALDFDSLQRTAPRRVWIVPGIMGTQLGRERPADEPPDVLWLDPIDVIHGRLPELRYHERDGIRSFGVLLHGLLRLKLRLIIAGYEARFFEYDWREPVQISAARLAADIRADGRRCSIVAHSMGGLVARCALSGAYAGTLPTIDRIVLLGTPNSGAWAAVQALRGTYAVVRRLAMLDAQRSAEDLAREVFASLPSLHDLLPSGAFAEDQDLLDPRAWPSDGLAVNPALAIHSRALQTALAPADARFAIVAGFGQRTVTGARRTAAGFRYRFSLQGDGTVAVRSARMAGQPLWLARCSHSDLPRDALVARAVIELLDDGTTHTLSRLDPTEAGPDETVERSTSAIEADDEQLRRTLTGKLDWGALSADARREFLEGLNDPGPL